MAPTQKEDKDQKVAARRSGTPSAKPGAVSVTFDQAARLDKRIAEKRRATENSKKTPPQALGHLEEDLLAKQRGRASIVISKPAAISASTSTTRSEASDLEADVAAKQRARPGASAEALDSKIAAKVRGEGKPGSSEELRNLEVAIQAKMRRGGAASVGTSSPRALASLTSLEDEAKAKQGDGRFREELSRLDERIAAKNAAAVRSTISAHRSLQGVGGSDLKTNGVTQGSGDIMTKRDDGVAEQYSDERKEIHLDSSLQQALSLADQSELLNPDLEYGVHGGPGENNLAVALAVEEEDEDMFIPSAVEYDPDAKPPMYRNRRFRLYACLAIVVVIVGTIGAAVGVTLSQGDGPPAVPYRETLGIRENIERIVGSDQLNDLSSPYRKALDWITDEDPMALTPDHPQFTQRYLAAYFYFATSVKHPWSSGCNRPGEGEDENCVYHQLVSLDPPEYSDVPWKRWLSALEECAWAGIYCDESGQFRSMEFYGSNQTGSFPAGIAGFPFLQSFSAVYSELEGPLPDVIGDMKHLVNLEIQGNLFTGPIPDAWYKSRSLQRINLSLNQISGPISKNINQLKDIKGLFLLENAMTGTLPDEIGELNSASYFRINRNLFNGTLPTTLGKLEETADFWLQRNQFTGTIPTEVGLMTNLVDFRLQVNLLTGTIPEELYNVSATIQRIDLYENHLTGNITSGIGKLTNMDTLHINDNNFSGTLPTELGLLTTMTSFVASGNNFAGTVPIQLCALRDPSALSEVQADCAVPSGGLAEIECAKDCCTDCCDADGGNCVPSSGA